MITPRQLGVSTASLAGYSLAEACRLAHELGFTGLELTAFEGFRHAQGYYPGFYFERLTAAEKTRLKALVAPFERVSVHAQFYDLGYLSPNPTLRQVAWDQLVIALEATAFLGGQICTTHAAPKVGHSLHECWAELVEYYRRLGDVAGHLGVMVNLETRFPVANDDFAALIDEIDHPAVGVTVDVAHLRGLIDQALIGTPAVGPLYNDYLEEHLRLSGDKLTHVHLHDLRNSDFRNHRACGRGLIDFPRLIKVLRELDYQGGFIFEFEEADQLEALRAGRACLTAAMKAAGATADQSAPGTSQAG
jgi:sugar phosphate isomerase/epimerase